MRTAMVFILCALLFCFGILCACAINPPTEEQETVSAGTDAQSSDGGLLKSLLAEPLEISEELITLFFQYYRLNTYELSMLPPFSASKQVDWDLLTLYTYLSFVRPRNEAVYDNSSDVLTKEAFAETVRKYFGEVDYTDHSSAYLTYADGVYTMEPVDATRNGYYCLTDISKDAGGVYTASFDVLFFSETERSDSYEQASSNIKVIRDAAGTKEVMQKAAFEKAVLDIFCSVDARETLDMTEKITIQFTLSGDNTFLFVYKSCVITSY